jgi:hypothetical protein
VTPDADRADRSHALPADAVRGYAIYGYQFAIATRSAAAGRLLDRLYAPHAVAALTGPYDAFGVEYVRHERRASWQVRTSATECAAYSSLGAALRALEYAICSRVLAYRSDLIVLHGATLLRSGLLTLVLGRSGAGKTTLAIALTTHGFRLLSDDIALLDPASNQLLPLPRCFHLDRRSRGLLASVGVALPAAAVQHGFVTPADLGDATAGASTLRNVVLLTGGTGDAASADGCRVTQAETAVELLYEAGWTAEHGAAPLSALASLLARADCIRLSRGPLGELSGRVSSFCEANEAATKPSKPVPVR